MTRIRGESARARPAAVAVGLAFVATLVASCQGESQSGDSFGLGTEATATITSSTTLVAEATSTATVESTTETPTEAAPTASPTPEALPRPSIVLEGQGNFAGTNPITLNEGPYRITTAYPTRGVFSVNLIDNTGRSRRVGGGLGPLVDHRYFAGGANFLLEIEGEGPWTVSIAHLEDDATAEAEISGRGNAVSGRFQLQSGEHSYGVFHDGESNVIIALECENRRHLLVNDIGAVDGIYTLDTDGDPVKCAWFVQAQGEWAIRLR